MAVPMPQGTGYRFFKGDAFTLRTLSSSGATVTAMISILYDDGTETSLTVTTVAETNRTVVVGTSSALTRSGIVVGARVTTTGGVRRGQLWVTLRIGHVGDIRRQALCMGYIYDEKPLYMGVFEDILSGKGFLHWVQEADDAAGNATTTVNLAASNAHRIVRAVIIKIHSSGDVATRTWTMTLRDLATAAGPTNWSIASDTWVSPTLTLTADEEGLIHVGEHGFVSTNDAGTLAYADNSSAPNPFPLELEDGETADLIIAAGAGEAADDYDVWVQYEEWLEV